MANIHLIPYRVTDYGNLFLPYGVTYFGTFHSADRVTDSGTYLHLFPFRVIEFGILSPCPVELRTLESILALSVIELLIAPLVVPLQILGQEL